MFQAEGTCATWSHTSYGRGKRVEEVKVGCFVVEHIATGKFLVETSKTVSKDVDKVIELIKKGELLNKAFLKLCQLDPDVKLYEYAAADLKAAKRIEADIRKTAYPKYLLLN